MEQPLDDEAVASARQHDQVTDLRRKLLDTGACAFFKWPPFLGEIPPMVEAQYAALNAWLTGKKKKEQAERSASWRAVNASVWDLAILNEDDDALTPDQIAQAELQAWSKLWQPGEATPASRLGGPAA
eukprot:5576867-Amphidinium_carterae.2